MELPVINPILVEFGTDARPLRPSKCAKLLSCAMQTILDIHAEDNAGKAAQTGNLVHDACEVFHKTFATQEERVAAGLAAIEQARAQFPQGDEAKARKIFGLYAADKENQEAEVVWCEQAVRLVLPSDTGPVVIAGTLDQVRRHKDGRLRVWDVKTGDKYTGEENLIEYSIQQAVYTLGARETLSPEILPGGLIFTPNYGKMKVSAHIPLRLTVEQCKSLLTLLPAVVSQVRRGQVPTRPSIEGCRWCPHGPFPKCLNTYRGLFV